MEAATLKPPIVHDTRNVPAIHLGLTPLGLLASFPSFQAARTDEYPYMIRPRYQMSRVQIINFRQVPVARLATRSDNYYT